MMRLLFLFVALLVAAPPVFAQVKVVATIPDLAAIAKEVGGDKVEIETICRGNQDPHAVEILPNYMLYVRRAALFLKVGLDLELWAPGIIQGSRNPGLRVVDCSTGIRLLEVPTSPVNASQGDIHAGGNPHYWLDPANGAIIARNIATGLALVDPANAAYYEERRADFERRLNAKIAEWKEKMKPFAGAPVVYFHNSWPYFNEAFGLTAPVFVEPKPGVTPSPGHTAEVIKLIQARRVKVIAVEAQYDKRVPQSIARQSGAQMVVLATSVGGVEEATDYFALFDANLSRLAAALGAPK